MTNKSKRRASIPSSVRRAVLIEAGYRCAVPSCRTLITLDIHHIVEVREDGGNTLGNLLALCPNCHALFTRGEITREAIESWKGVLVALNQAFDKETVSFLVFLGTPEARNLVVSGDGVLRFAHLVGAGLATCQLKWSDQGSFDQRLSVQLTDKGRRLLDAWTSGNRTELRAALSHANAEDDT